MKSPQPLSGPPSAADTGLTASLATRYRLPPESEVKVTVGETVNRGDLLASAPQRPLIVAVAAELEADRAQDAMGAIPRTGTAVQAGEPLARLRRGLRTRLVRTPATGVLSARNEAGVALIASPDARTEIRARYAGIVTQSGDGGIIVTTSAAAVPFAYGSPLPDIAVPVAASMPLLTGTFTTRTAIPSSAANAALVIGHIDEMKSLAHARRAARVLVIGSIAESVAWELCTGHGAANEADAPVIVLLGPGDADAGEHAVAHLQRHDGETIVIDREARTLLILDEDAGTDRTEVLPDDSSAPVFHEPAYWLEPVQITGTLTGYALENGLRVLAVPTTSARRGAALTPLENLSKTL
jgi:hypothetical protein